MTQLPMNRLALLVLAWTLALGACAPVDYVPHARAFARVVDAGAVAAERLAVAERQAGADQTLLAVAADPELSLMADECRPAGAAGCASELAMAVTTRSTRALRAYAAALVRLAGTSRAAGEGGSAPALAQTTLDRFMGERRRQALLAHVSRSRPALVRLSQDLHTRIEHQAASVRMVMRNQLTFALRHLRRSRDPGFRLLLAGYARERTTALKDLVDRPPAAALDQIMAGHDLLHQALQAPAAAADALRKLQELAAADPTTLARSDP